jgi:hypothetical protein
LVARFNPRTGQKKVENISLFIIRPATPPDRSEPKISTDGACADSILFRTNPIRCLFYGEEISLYWKSLDRTGSEKTSIRSDPLLIFRSGNWPLLEIACWIGPDRKNLQSGPILCLLSGVEISLKTIHDPTNRYGPHKLSSGFTDRANRTVRENCYSFKKMGNSRFRCVFLDNYYLLINFWL